jgi:hypothetical protein
MHFRLLVAFAFGALLAPVAWGAEIAHTYTFAAPTISSVTIDGTEYSRVTMAEAPFTGGVHQPRLPAYAANMLIPRGQAVDSVAVTGDATVLQTPHPVEPVGLPFAISLGPTAENIPSPDYTIYSSSDPFPASRYVSLGIQNFRGYDILIVRLQPVSWVPSTRALYWYPSLTVTVQLKAGTESPLFRGLSEDEAVATSRVDNENDAWGENGTVIGTYQPTQPRTGEMYDLLILTTPEYASEFEPLENAHEQHGIPTHICTTQPSSAAEIREFIHQKYDENGIRYALIGGGDDVLPAPRLRALCPQGEQDLPSDFYLGCLGHDYSPEYPYARFDLTAEVYIGRAAADSEAEVTNFVDKTVAYINTGQHAHLDRVLEIGEHLEETVYGCARMDQLIDGITAEGYTTAGIPSSVFDIDRLYDIPQGYSTPGYQFPPNAVLSRMNAGVHWINHLGHGHPTDGLRLSCRSYPTVQPCGPLPGGGPVSDLQALSNSDYFFIYSQACHCGSFDTAECLAEAFTTKNACGAFAVIMNARWGWGAMESTDPSQCYHRWFWDAAFYTDPDHPDPDPPGTGCTYGAANQYSKEKTSFGSPRRRTQLRRGGRRSFVCAGASTSSISSATRACSSGPRRERSGYLKEELRCVFLLR